MYRVHLATSTVSQNCSIPCTNSSFVRGFTSRLRNSLSSCQRFSIGLQSGDSGGVFHQYMPFDKRYIPEHSVTYAWDRCLAWNDSIPLGKPLLQMGWVFLPRCWRMLLHPLSHQRHKFLSFPSKWSLPTHGPSRGVWPCNEDEIHKSGQATRVLHVWQLQVEIPEISKHTARTPNLIKPIKSGIIFVYYLQPPRAVHVATKVFCRQT